MGVVWAQTTRSQKCQRMTNAVKTTFYIIIVRMYVKCKQCYISFLHELQQCSICVRSYTPAPITQLATI